MEGQATVRGGDASSEATDEEVDIAWSAVLPEVNSDDQIAAMRKIPAEFHPRRSTPNHAQSICLSDLLACVDECR